MIPMLEMTHRDLQRFTRVKYFWWRRFLFVGVVVVTFFIAISEGSAQNTDLGHKIISTTTSALLTLIFFLAPTSSSHAILEEIEKKTLGLLVITDLSYMNVVLGKYLQRVFLVLLNSFAVLPIFFCAISLGGIAAEQIIAVWVILFGCLILAVAMGILASTICTTSLKAPSYAFIFTMIAASPITGTSAHAAVINVIQYGETSPAYLLLGIYFTITAVTLMFCIAYLPTKLHRSTEAPTSVKIKRSFRKALEKRQAQKNKNHNTGTKAKVVGKNILGNPVYWRDYHILHSSQGTEVIRYLLIIFVFVVIFSFAGISTYGSRNTEFYGIIFAFMFFIFLGVLALSNVSCALNSFVKETSQKAWQLLLITPLKNNEIVYAKIKAILKTTLPYLLTVLFSGIMCLLCLRFRSRDIEMLCSFVAWGAMYLFCLTSFALFCSFYYRTYRKASNFLFLFVFLWHFLSNIIFGGAYRYDTGLMAFNYTYAIIYFVIGTTSIKYIINNLRKNIVLE